jgi:hypothetical protein
MTDSLSAIRKVRLLSPPIVDLGDEFVIDPHLKGSWHCTARRPSDCFFGHACNFGIDRHGAYVYHNDRLGKSQNAEDHNMLMKLDQSLPFETRLAEIEHARQSLVEAARQRLDARIVQHVEFRATEVIDGMLGSTPD